MSIFQKIIDKEIPAKIVYEDELCLAFHDVSPQAPVHILLIPKKPIPSLADISLEDKELLGHLMLVIQQITEDKNLHERGYRVVTNIKEDGGQSVPHLHFHILGGKPLVPHFG